MNIVFVCVKYYKATTLCIVPKTNIQKVTCVLSKHCGYRQGNFNLTAETEKKKIIHVLNVSKTEIYF